MISLRSKTIYINPNFLSHDFSAKKEHYHKDFLIAYISLAPLSNYLLPTVHAGGQRFDSALLHLYLLLISVVTKDILLKA